MDWIDSDNSIARDNNTEHACRFVSLCWVFRILVAGNSDILLCIIHYMLWNDHPILGPNSYVRLWLWLCCGVNNYIGFSLGSGGVRLHNISLPLPNTLSIYAVVIIDIFHVWIAFVIGVNYAIESSPPNVVLFINVWCRNQWNIELELTLVCDRHVC